MMTTAATGVVDAAGNPTSGTSDAVDRYDGRSTCCCATTPTSSPRPRAWPRRPDLPMGQVFVAYLNLMSTDVPDLAGARGGGRSARGAPAERA